MEMNRETLGRRISATLRAKQRLVFFAIGIYGLNFAAWALALWLADGGTTGEILREGGSFVDAVIGGPIAIVVALTIATLALTAWLRAGYIRSIVGSFHPGPHSVRQWASLFGLLAITEGVNWGTIALTRAAASEPLIALVYIAVLAIGFVLLYADYAIVISDLNPLVAIGRSWATARRTGFVSLVVLLGVALVFNVVSALMASRLDGGLLDVLPLLLVRVLVEGTVYFVADVVLTLTYIDAIQRGVVPSGRER